jgi:hypothetical protein
MTVSEETTTRKKYREFQFSWLLTGILVPIHGFVAYLYVNGLGNRPLSTDGFMIMTGVGLFIYLIFYGMTTEVAQARIRLVFGIGLFRKRIDLSRVRSVAVVSNPWYYGYGIRLVPNGWLYNVGGPHAVELRFHDRKGVIMIGTRDPQKLKREIESYLTN